MSYLGDYKEDYTKLNFMFTTRKDTGLPTVLTGSPVITIYKGSSTFGKTSAESYITLDIDFNSKVGLNHVLADLSGDAFFAIGEDYNVVITTGTVNSISVIGETVATFSIENRFAEVDVTKWLGTACKAPTTAGVPKIDLDHVFGVILTEGGAGRLAAAFIKLFDVATPTLVASDVMRGTDSANTDKTGFSLSTAGILAIWHQLNSAIVTAGSMGKLLKDEITAVRMAVLTDWIDAGRLDTILDAIPTTAMRGTDSALTDKDGFTLSTAGILAVWHQLNSAIVTAGSMGKLLKDEITAVRMAILTDWIDAGRLDVILDAILLDTGTTLSGRIPAALVGGRMDSSVGAMATDVLTAASLNSDAVDKISEGILPKQNEAFSNLQFTFVSSGDHVTPVTGATGTGVTRSIDGVGFAAGTGTLAEIANGLYQYDASAADMNGGKITFRFVGTGGTPAAPDDVFVTIVTSGGV